jgi:hypothetical protein
MRTWPTNLRIKILLSQRAPEAHDFFLLVSGSFLLSDFISISCEFIAFLSCHFVLLCSLIISSSLFYGETKELHA